MKLKSKLAGIIAAGFLALSLNISLGINNNIENCVSGVYDIGNSQVTLKSCGKFYNAEYVMTALHRDEVTGIKLAFDEGPNIIYLAEVNPGVKERWIRYKISDIRFKVDPNRIFSYDGAKESLEQHTAKWEQATERQKEKALDEAVKLGEELTSLYEQYQGIICLHNNYNKGFDVKNFKNESYVSKSGGKVYVSTKEDPDDFFFVTREKDFEKLKEMDYNVVLQERSEQGNNGSLSWWAYDNNVPYINVEAQYSHYDKQKEMLDIAKKLITEL